MGKIGTLGSVYDRNRFGFQKRPHKDTIGFQAGDQSLRRKIGTLGRKTDSKRFGLEKGPYKPTPDFKRGTVPKLNIASVSEDVSV